MAILTNYYQVKSAIDFSNQSDIWIEFAKDTPWTDETKPDSENPAITDLDSSQLFVKSNSLILLYPAKDTDSDDNVIIYKNSRWIPSGIDDAYKNNATFVLLSYKIDAGTTDNFTWRQTGIRKGTTPVEAGSKTLLKPSEVSDKGKLLAFDNHVPQNYSNDTVATVQYLMEF